MIAPHSSSPMIVSHTGSNVTVSTGWRPWLALYLVLCAVGTCAAEPQKVYDIRLCSQSVADALNGLSEQTGAPVVFAYDLVRNRTSNPVIGRYTLEEALDVLLKDTGLSGGFSDRGVLTISASKSTTPKLGESIVTQHNAKQNNNQQNKTKILPTRPPGKLFALLTSIGAAFSAWAAEPTDDSAPMANVVITAQKREERLQDVPVPVTAIDVNTLAEHGEDRLRDFFTMVPGLSLMASSTNGGGTQELAIRGVTTGGSTNPTVGVTIDDVPFGSNSYLANGQRLFPDIDPSELERIEVLRGPQGTLYGASSIGGLIKFVTRDPSTSGISGGVQLLGEDVDHGQPGYGLRGSINVPLGDTAAARISGFTRRDPGYVDNILTGQRYANQADAGGGHVSFLWRPTEALTLKLGALVQNIDGEGTPAVDTNIHLQPTLGDLQQARIRGTEQYTSEVRLYTATLRVRFAELEFTSVTGYGTNKYIQLGDSTLGYGSTAQDIFGVSGSGDGNDFKTDKFSQEFRFGSHGGGVVDWLVGGFYTRENTPADQYIAAVDPLTGAVPGRLEDFYYPNTLSEYAVFGDVTFRPAERFDIQFGGRESWDRQVYNETDSGPLTLDYYGASSPFVNPTEHTKGNAFTYLVTPQLRLSDKLMLYARLTSGYRVGGPNANAIVSNAPVEFAPDRTYNYEVGAKGDLFDRALTFDASVYYLTWKQIQLSVFDPAIGAVFLSNGGNAKSQGVELSVQTRPLRGLTITAASSVAEAKLTQDFPPNARAFGRDGDPLPFSARFTGSLSAEQAFSLSDHWSSFLSGSLTYVGQRTGQFESKPTTPRVVFPAYADFDLRVGVRHESLTTTIFLNNVADRRGIIGGGESGAESAYDAVYIQPRTVGVSFVRTF